MTTRSSSAYFISVLLHGSVVALILFFAYLANETSQAGPKVFELVAGAGDNYGATEAPALGAPGGVKIDVPLEPRLAALTPAAPVEPVAVTPPVPEPAVVESAAQEEAPPVRLAPVPAHAIAKPKPKPTTKPAAKPNPNAVPNFSKVMQRTENRRVARLMAKYKKQLEAEERRQQMSYDEYVKEHGAAAAEGIAQGVAGGSRANKTGGAGGKALTREQSDLLDAYWALLKARLKENHVAPPDLSDKLSVSVSFYVAADGTISRVHIIQSSGSSIFDESVLEAFARMHSIGPRPDGRGDTERLEYKVRDEDE